MWDALVGFFKGSSMVCGGGGVGEGKESSCEMQPISISMLYYNPQVDPKLGCLKAKDTARVCPLDIQYLITRIWIITKSTKPY